ncbi:MAG: hypothetical protein RDV48_04535 [Candidatus Eremiobacteraeota bacterium]|nr:hypothetical protein [Candidatus Eremiobacteraeota bacterium]
MTHSDPLNAALLRLFGTLHQAVPTCRGEGIPFTPELKEDLLEKLEEARDLLRHDLGLPITADDHDISEKLRLR